MFTLSRVRSFLIDVVLIGAASSAVLAWLLEHHDALLVILAGFHLLMLPLLTLTQLISGAPGAKFLTERTPLSKAFIWSYVLYFGAGFIVPAVLGLTVGMSLAAMFTIIFGPYVVMVLAVAAVIALDKRTNYRLSRMGAEAPKSFVRVLVFSCWAYLLCMEAMLMVAAASHGQLSGGMTLGAAIVGYLPVRLCIALAQDTKRWNLIALFGAFFHFLYRLSVA